MEEPRDEVDASEEAGTTKPLDSSASVPKQSPAQQTPLMKRVVLLLQDTEAPPACQLTILTI